MGKLKYNKKTVDELTFTDDGMFQVVLSDPQIAAELVERLLFFKVGHIEYPEIEKTIAPYFSSKGVRLDVYIKDSDRVIDVEIQTYPQEAIGLRTRYYQSMIDTDLLLKGHDYSELPASYVLFICKKDPFMNIKGENYGLPCYTFETVCKENENVKLGDKNVKVIYNASAYDREKDRRIRDFLYFIHTNSTGEDDFSRRLFIAVERIKKNDLFRREYAIMNLHDRDIQRKARAEGASQKAIEAAGNLLKLNVLTYEQIAQVQGLPLEKVQEIAESICVNK